MLTFSQVAQDIMTSERMPQNDILADFAQNIIADKHTDLRIGYFLPDTPENVVQFLMLQDFWQGIHKATTPVLPLAKLVGYYAVYKYLVGNSMAGGQVVEKYVKNSKPVNNWARISEYAVKVAQSSHLLWSICNYNAPIKLQVCCKYAGNELRFTSPVPLEIGQNVTVNGAPNTITGANAEYTEFTTQNSLPNNNKIIGFEYNFGALRMPAVANFDMKNYTGAGIYFGHI
jgi:hypothetical protein